MSKFENTLNASVSDMYALWVKASDFVFGTTVILPDETYKHPKLGLRHQQTLIEGSFHSGEWVVTHQERTVGGLADQWHTTEEDAPLRAADIWAVTRPEYADEDFRSQGHSEWEDIRAIFSSHGEVFTTADIEKFIEAENPEAFAKFQRQHAAYKRPIFFKRDKAAGINPV